MPLVEGGNWDLILSNLLLPSLLWNFFNVVNKLCKLYYSIYIFCYFQMKSSVKRLIQKKTIVLHRLTSKGILLGKYLQSFFRTSDHNSF